MFIANMVMGTYAAETPTVDARSTRNAWLNRARVKTEPTVTVDQNSSGNSVSLLHRMVAGSFSAEVGGGSWGKRTRIATDKIAGTTAIQKTKRKLPPVDSIRIVARRGPATAPTVSSV